MKLSAFFKVMAAIVLMLGLLPFSASAAEAPFVQVMASKTNPAVGEDVTFSVNLKNFNAPSHNLSSFEVKLSFDPAYWDALSNQVDFGSYLQALQSYRYEMPINSVTQSTGSIHMALSIYKNDQVTYFSGDGTLFTFKLKAKKNGQTNVSMAKSLFVQISKPGINVTHGVGAANLDIGGTTPPPPPPIDPGGGTAPGGSVPSTPAEVERSQTPMTGGGMKETIGFSGEKAKNTIDQAIQNKSNAVEIKASTSSGNEADFISISTSADTVSQLVANNLSLLVTSEKGQMEISPSTLKGINQNLTIDVFLQTDKTKMENTKKLISQNVRNGQSVGNSTEITTNFSGRTKVTLPLDSKKLPTNAADLENYLKTLGIFVQHSDGKWEYIKGDVQFDQNGKPVAISIFVNRFSTFTVVSESKGTLKYVDDKDISPYAYSSVYKAQEMGIMTGLNSEPRFGPSQSLTRAQFTKIILNMLGEEPTAKSVKKFKDVPENYWAHDYIMRAVELGIIKGLTADSFSPGATITREQVALMIGRAYKMKVANSSISFKDEAKINKEALPYIKALQAKGIMNGSQGFFNPKQTVTREMAAVIAVRTIETNK